MVPWTMGSERKMCGLSPNGLSSTSMTMGGRVSPLQRTWRCGWQDPGRTIVHPRATRDMFIVPWVCLTGVTCLMKVKRDGDEGCI